MNSDEQVSAKPENAIWRCDGSRWALAAALSVVAHFGVMLALFAALTPPPAAEPNAVQVALVDWRPAVQRPAPRPVAPAYSAAAPAQKMVVRASLQPARIDAPAAVAPPAADAGSELSEADIAGSATADSGPDGAACNMPARLQSALRRDPLVQAAVAGSAAKAMMVWNGDWVRQGGEDGKGLAAVREAIMWEVAFAPPACRAEPVHGLVLISVNPGAARLALGSVEWRWSDLLTPSRVLSSAARPAQAG